MRRHMIALALACPLVLVVGGSLFRPGVVGADEPRKPDAATAWTTAVDPKPLSPQVKKALAWLAEHQNKNGGWGQGEEMPNMRASSRDELRDTPNIADTCIAALALIRSGNTPAKGPYRDAVAKAVRFVEQSVESSDSASIAVTTVQGTRVQQKLGPNIDTFLASLLLAEVKGRMNDESEDRRVTAALDKVLDKINRHQKADGSFDGQGWAPILADCLCGKGINRARQAGANVPAMALARSENGAKMAAMAMSAPAAPVGASGLGGAAGVVTVGSSAGGIGSFTSDTAVRSDTARPSLSSGARSVGSVGAGAAGVELYGRSANISQLQDAVNTAKLETPRLLDEARNASTAEQRNKARKRLDEIADTEKVHQKAQAEVIDRLADPQFIAGFGSNGGEEFLSYMNLAETLVVKGGDEWKSWDEKMTANLNRIQNEDGTWTGHHCITGRTFCTSTALLVLLADRTPIPAQAKTATKPETKR
jgi:hypothetical protein